MVVMEILTLCLFPSLVFSMSVYILADPLLFSIVPRTDVGILKVCPNPAGVTSSVICIKKDNYI